MAKTETTRPLTDESWVYWQKLAGDEHDRQAAEIERLRAMNAKMLRALNTISDAYLGLEGINDGTI